jgi:hypothetical protein
METYVLWHRIIVKTINLTIGVCMEKELERPERGAILQVPFAEKERVKKLGARWDPDIKRWFVPKGVDIEPFSEWLSDRGKTH